MARLEWRQQARNDLLTIIDYISDDNPNAAQQLKDEIERKTQDLLQHPKAWRPGRVATTRELIIRNNYIIVYHESPAIITILRVLHAAQQWP